MEKELKRQSLYDEIEANLVILKKSHNFTFDEKICYLEKLNEELKNELETNKTIFASILNSIRKNEQYLEVEQMEFVEEFDSKNISAMREYNEYLISDIKRLFKQIFNKVKEDLDEVHKIFGIESNEFNEINEETLERMREEVERLLPKKDLFCEISELINRRILLIQKMTEFEKIASDPGRLFKSSFQLNSEEKFRNSAYPSLLRIEKSIFDLISKYENDFGKFYYKGSDYKAHLQQEIDNRIINRTVFISRCDSPYKKRK